MGRLIDVGALLAYPMQRATADKNNANPHFIHGVESVLEFAKALPTVDAAPVVHGRWKLIETGYGIKKYFCSQCKEDEFWKYRNCYGNESYCPNCGAKMDLEE